ncbi:hypothetical protein KY290_013550 [Solanum tuberosum]|uniref:DUF4218 domain-containing protein n=1 Tax=Solanum tuberosum TaxID=4113 RepID=A0ABQ7VM19_SOLTU|nr:hypothetical protein KY289_013660 [Solanum tuberosum]KAH0716986.1 hypothetical protein KY285_013017 [Solanum tuberosum]KAH0769569.1 hypothetical protein KY290_013550 [Solanum tuberosum]
MFHLVIHIGEEAILAGPVQGHWMYPVERKFRIRVSRMYRGKRNSSKLVEEYVHKHFHEWFKEYVASQNGVEITPEIEVLANGPNNVVRRFKEYNIHGFKFCTMWKEQGLKTQNSGVVMSAVTKRFSNGRESIEQSSDDMYYDLEEPPMEDIPFCEQHLENIEDLPLVQVDRDEQEQGDSTGDSGGDDDDVSLRGQQANNISITSQDLQQQFHGDQPDEQLENENIITPTLRDSNINTSSSSNEANKQEKEEPLVVKIKDTSTGEVTTQKMQPDRVWNLEKNKNIMVELNGDGQGSDNGSNLLARFLGKLSQKSVFCPISVERWDRMPKAKTHLQWQLIEENFEFDYAIGIKWVMHSLRDRWRAYKYKLRCDHFYPNKSKEEILANRPTNVDCNDWTAFVHHYKEDKMKFWSRGPVDIVFLVWFPHPYIPHCALEPCGEFTRDARYGHTTNRGQLTVAKVY